MLRKTAVFLISCIGAATAQAPVFRLEMRLVQVPVSVNSRNGRDVEGLQARDFRVLDDGVRQQITLDRFDTGVAPISLAIATTFEQAMEAVQREGIEVFGAHYSAYATGLIAKPEDLPDTTSTPTTSIAGPEGPPTTNILGIFTELARLGKTNAIQALTQATGGSDYPFLKARGIEKAIEKPGVEVHSQYILNFAQRADLARPGMHRIEVSVPDRGNLRLRFRQGY